MKRQIARVFLWFSLLLVLGCLTFSSCRSRKKGKRKSGHTTSKSANISKKGVKPDAPKAIIAREPKAVIKAARSYLGTPYKSGGVSRLGMDCSGLVFTVFQQAGFGLPRASYEMAETGEEVKKSRLKPGDLVFFSIKSSEGKINHVGMVTDVDDGRVKFIHSSTSLGVIESNMDEEYYVKYFAKAVRPDW